MVGLLGGGSLWLFISGVLDTEVWGIDVAGGAVVCSGCLLVVLVVGWTEATAALAAYGRWRAACAGLFVFLATLTWLAIATVVLLVVCFPPNTEETVYEAWKHATPATRLRMENALACRGFFAPRDHPGHDDYDASDDAVVPCADCIAAWIRRRRNVVWGAIAGFQAVLAIAVVATGARTRPAQHRPSRGVIVPAWMVV